MANSSRKGAIKVIYNVVVSYMRMIVEAGDHILWGREQPCWNVVPSSVHEGKNYPTDD